MPEPSHKPDSGGPAVGVPHHPVAVTVVIPMYREAGRIGATLRDCVPALAGAGHTSELVLVDDGSPDDTVEIVRPFLSESPRGSLRSVRLLRHNRNLGKGAAVRTGLRAGVGRWRLIMDADNAATVRELAKLLARAGPGVGLVAGSRVAAGARVEAIASRRLAGSVFKAALRALGLSLLADTQCGFKLYRADLAEQVVAAGVEDGYAFDLEHLLIARATGLEIAEVGIEWTHMAGGQVDPVADGIRMLRRALSIRLRRAEICGGVARLPREQARPETTPVIVTMPVAPPAPSPAQASPGAPF